MKVINVETGITTQSVIPPAEPVPESKAEPTVKAEPVPEPKAESTVKGERES